jgi:hypothetical protein
VLGGKERVKNRVRFLTVCQSARLSSVHSDNFRDYILLYDLQPILVAARSKAYVWGGALAGIVGSNPTGGMDVCLLWVFLLSGRGLCDGPIPRPEESYRLWCVSECDQVKINNLDTCCEQVEEGRTTKWNSPLWIVMWFVDIYNI